MKCTGRFLILCLLLTFLPALEVSLPAAAGTNDPAVKDLNTPRTFPDIKNKAEWEERAKNIREQVLVSCGLWPMPEKEAHVGRAALVLRAMSDPQYAVDKITDDRWKDWASDLYYILEDMTKGEATVLVRNSMDSTCEMPQDGFRAWRNKLCR